MKMKSYSGFASLLILLLSLTVHVQAAEEVAEKITPEMYQEYQVRMEFERSKLAIAQAQAGASMAAENVRHRKALALDTEAALAAQGVQTVLIAIMVHIMVFLALYLSYLQFKADIAGKSSGAKQTTIKISKDGVEFSSSVIGLIILFMSFWFFSVYVDHVYDIQVNFPPTG